MSDDSYIKINRSILEWEWYANINTKVLFFHMLLKANWKDGKFEGTTVPRGSFVSSIGKLAKETGLTGKQVRIAISHLKSTGEVASKVTSKYSVFTVANYDMYQLCGKQTASERQADGKQRASERQADGKQRASERQADGKQRATIEEGKKERSKDIPPISPTEVLCFCDFFTAYPKQVNMLEAEKQYNLVLFDNPNLSEDELIASAKNYAESVSILGTQDRFIKNPDRFLSDGRYIDFLAGRYKKPCQQQNHHDINKGIMLQDYGDMAELEKEILSN